MSQGATDLAEKAIHDLCEDSIPQNYHWVNSIPLLVSFI